MPSDSTPDGTGSNSDLSALLGSSPGLYGQGTYQPHVRQNPYPKPGKGARFHLLNGWKRATLNHFFLGSSWPMDTAYSQRPAKQSPIIFTPQAPPLISFSDPNEREAGQLDGGQSEAEHVIAVGQMTESLPFQLSKIGPPREDERIWGSPTNWNQFIIASF
ncbi:hypothetical protein BT69DRAFT_1376834 [Atractiella rhizophila]|nr:hypothetical protein BT69DRAFT_1376834 [Atractiella rhizophila]